MLLTFILVVAGAYMPAARKDKRQKTNKDSIALADTLGQDSIIPVADNNEPDTTLMDSLALAIYRHNKQVDDSIRLDSINRAKSTGVDAPVKFAAEDSMVYRASDKLAFLYGNSNVNYQNMNLTSADITRNMDRNERHHRCPAGQTGVQDGRDAIRQRHDSLQLQNQERIYQQRIYGTGRRFPYQLALKAQRQGRAVS